MAWVVYESLWATSCAVIWFWEECTCTSTLSRFIGMLVWRIFMKFCQAIPGIMKNESVKIWLIITVACMHTTYTVVKLKPEKNSGLNRIWTHDLCDTSAVLYQLSYQAIWEMVTLRVCNISPIEGEEFKWIHNVYESSHIWTAENDVKILSIISINHKLFHNSRSPQFKYKNFHIFIWILHLLWVYYELTMWPAPRWLDSSVGKALYTPVSQRSWVRIPLSPECSFTL